MHINTNWDQVNKWVVEIDDYKRPFTEIDEDDFIRQLVLDNIKKETGARSTPKGTENHFGVIEDVKQPLTLDPSLDF